MISCNSKEIWTRPGEVAIQVMTSRCLYRVVFDERDEEAHVLAPGLDLTIELDEDVHPEDREAAAMVIIAQLEGGMQL